MSTLGYMDMFKRKLFGELDTLGTVRTPIIAAVNGFALGGGCELAMACDLILAADTATFGQPEIKLGTIPGLGGTQRFARALGKSRAMELVLTGDQISAQEACARGLVSRVVPAAELLDEAVLTGEKIAASSQPVVAMAKACVNAAFETSLAEGLRFERAIFYSTFATMDQKASRASRPASPLRLHTLPAVLPGQLVDRPRRCVPSPPSLSPSPCTPSPTHCTLPTPSPHPPGPLFQIGMTAFAAKQKPDFRNE